MPKAENWRGEKRYPAVILGLLILGYPPTVVCVAVVVAPVRSPDGLDPGVSAVARTVQVDVCARRVGGTS